MDTDDRTRGGDADPNPNVVLVERARRGDDRAFGELYDAWFDRVHDLAYGVVRDRSVAAEVAQDTFLRAWQQLDSIRDPAVFGGWLLRIARNTALNRRRTELRTTAVDDEGLAVIERAGPSPASAPVGFRVEDRLHAADDPAAAVEDAELVTLVADAAEALDGRDAEVLHLGLRYGLTPAEIGETIGLTRNAANQAVHRARGRLRTAVEARVLWRRGAPECADLAALLAEAGIERFGADAVALADAHAGTCERCTQRRRLRLDPAVLFGAVPLVGAPAMLKTQIAHALAEQGVPMQGSGSAGAPGGDASGGDATAGDASGGDASGGDASGGDASGGDASGGDATAGDASGGDASGGDATGGPGSGEPAPGADPTTAVEAPADPTQLLPAQPVMAGPAERRGRRRLGLAAAGIALLVAAVIGVVALAGPSGEDDPRAGAAPVTRPEDLATPSTTATASAPTTVAETVPSETAPPATAPPPPAPPPVVVPPVTEPLPPPPPPPPPPTGTITVTPSVRARPWTMIGGSAPVLSWSTENAGSVTVEGPGLGSSSPSGSVLLCPNGLNSSQCFPSPPGPYRYRLTVRDAAGEVAFVREAVLVVSG